MKILKNSVRCKNCGIDIESKDEYSRVECSCGAVTITGGKKVLVRYGKEKDFVETSMVEMDCK